MHLRNGTLELSLELLEYQFPNATDDWDANWLNVRLKLSLPDGRLWEVVDPSLTAQEAHQLVAWLQEVTENAPVFMG